MTYDEKVPLQLKREQQWFGAIIGRPIDEDSRMNPVSPTGQLMEEEAALHIAPSPTLRPAQRIQIYNQQYWWRLLNTLHESFPLVTRLFGYFDFNRTIGIPYLTKYPPRHWSLALLGDRLSQWCLEDYHAPDKKLVVQAIELDWAFSHSFIVGAVVPLNSEQMAAQDGSEAVFDKVLYLQPYVHLFEYSYDLFKYRLDFLLQDPDYWLNHEFPILECSRPYYYLLHRNPKNEISWKEISKGEYLILSLFQKGTSIEKVCEWLEGQDPELCQTAMEKLQLWFHEWTQRGWLSLQNPNEVLADIDLPHETYFPKSNSLYTTNL